MAPCRLIVPLFLSTALAGCGGNAAPPPGGGIGGSGNVAGTGGGGTAGTAGSGGIGGGGGNGGTAATGGMSGSGGFAGGSGGDGGASGMGGGGGFAGGTGGSGVAGQCASSSAVNAIVALAPKSARQVAAECRDGCEDEDDDQNFLDCVKPCIESVIPEGCSSCYGDLALCLRSAGCLDACASDACVPACEACPGYAPCFDQLDSCAGRESRDCFGQT